MIRHQHQKKATHRKPHKVVRTKPRKCLSTTNHSSKRPFHATSAQLEQQRDQPHAASTANPSPLTLADFTPPKGCNESQREKSLFRPSMYYVRNGTFAHHGFDENAIRHVQTAHFQPENAGDRAALAAVNLLRRGFDLFSGYHHPPPGQEDNKQYAMTKKQILTRCIMLESVAAVPGLVGSMCRHLASIRLLRRDLGWMEALVSESVNERYHLMSFINYYKPGPLFKLLILGAQGVMMNTFFISYLLFPRVCHRFVGFLEEEAVITYTRVIREIENGWHDDWALEPAPDIAVAYWKMRPDATFKDMVYYIRMDEAQHRSVNHTFANLDNANDPNPFALYYAKDSPLTKPSEWNVESLLAKPLGWRRHEIDVSASLHPEHPEFANLKTSHPDDMLLNNKERKM